MTVRPYTYIFQNIPLDNCFVKTNNEQSEMKFLLSYSDNELVKVMTVNVITAVAAILVGGKCILQSDEL